MYFIEVVFNEVGKELAEILCTKSNLGQTAYRVYKDGKQFFEVDNYEFIPDQNKTWSAMHYYNEIRPGTFQDSYGGSRCPDYAFQIQARFVAFSFKEKDRGYGLRLLPAFQKKYRYTPATGSGLSFETKLTRYIDNPVEIVREISPENTTKIQHYQLDSVAVMIDYQVELSTCDFSDKNSCNPITIVYE